MLCVFVHHGKEQTPERDQIAVWKTRVHPLSLAEHTASNWCGRQLSKYSLWLLRNLTQQAGFIVCVPGSPGILNGLWNVLWQSDKISLTGLKDTEWRSSLKHLCAVPSFSTADIRGQHSLSYAFLRSESIMRVSVLQLHSVKARRLPHACSLLHCKRLMNDSIIKHHWHDARARFLPVSDVGWLWCHSPIRNKSVHACMSSCQVMWDEQQGEPASATTAIHWYSWIPLFRSITSQTNTDFIAGGFGFGRIR